MSNFSENKKIAISAIAIFMVSFSVMLFFLGKGGGDLNHGETSVLNATEEKETASREKETLEPIFTTNTEGLIISSNDIFIKLIGSKEKELIGDKVFDYIKKEELADFAADFAKVIQNSEKKDGIGPYTIVNGTTEKLVLFSVKPVANKNNKVEEITFFAKDLSEKMQEYKEKTTESEEKSWYNKIYPKIKDSEEKDQKLLVDKITYKK